MEYTTALRSFQYSVAVVPHIKPSLEKPSTIPRCSTRYMSSSKVYFRGLKNGAQLTCSLGGRKGVVVSCSDTSSATKQTNSNASLDGSPQGAVEKKPLQIATFPDGLEALVLEVCDETEIAELKLKVGDFEMHLKRNIGVTKDPMANISPTVPPPIPSEPMIGSAVATPPPSSVKPSPEKSNTFVNVPLEKSSKLAALEASGAGGYVVVSSLMVGSFCRSRTAKGKKLPPAIAEGDVIKEGQTIGYIDQFGTQFPMKSDVAGEVLKILFNEGEAVGYGDPLIAVLPSFHDINIQ